MVLKSEHLQRTGSFKIRGAYNLISQLEAGVDVVAASAGNHAQGVALAASLMGHQATIYMPAAAPLPKVDDLKSPPDLKPDRGDILPPLPERSLGLDL